MKKRILSYVIAVVMVLAIMPISSSAAAVEADTASFISRSDGVWLWPLPQSAYNTFTDWAGCNGNNSCMFHSGNNHGGCVPAHNTSNGYGHNGIDVGVVVGTSVYATADGVLYCTSTDWSSRGITAVVEHPAGYDENGTAWSYYSIYQHLKSVVGSLDQKSVKAGDCIAYSGNTDGYGTGAAHLHFGIILAKSGLGYNMSRNPNSAISAVENKGWVLKEGFTEGRIMNNPALNSPAGYPTGYVVENLKSHAGSIMYTFSKTNVDIGAGSPTYTVSYDANGGSGAPSSQTKNYGENLTLSSTVPVRSGYIFLGWSTSASATSATYAAGGSYTVNASTTLFAVWKVAPLTVTLYNAAGTAWKTATCTAGSNYTIPSDYPTSSGYYFSGWSYTKGAEVFDVRPGDAISIASNTALYPVYVSHTDAISGEPVLIYNIDDFTENGYDIEEDIFELKTEVDTSYWTDWSDYSTTKVTASDTVEVKTTAMYRYYYYLCPGCGDHNPLAGGCGCGSSSNDFREKWSTVAYSKSSYKTVSYATSKCYTTSLGDGQMWYFSAGNKNHTAIGTVDSDSTSVVIKTGYSSRNYVKKTETNTQMVVAYIITEAEPVTVSKIEVATKPTKTTYEIGENLDTAGLALKVTYSDGSTKTITSGFTTSGFDSSTAGEKTVTVTYGGKSASFMVTVEAAEEVDPDAPQIVVSDSTGMVGQQVSVTIALVNNPGVASMMLSVGYDDDVLTLVSVTDGGQLGTAVHSDNYAACPYTLTWANDLATENYIYNGEIVTLTFEVVEGAQLGQTSVTVYYDYDNFDIFNVDGEEVWFEMVDGSVNVIDVLIGDVNSDGKVNTQDRMILTRYLAKWTGYTEDMINMTAADVNCDGKVNTQDRMILTRYLAKWTGYEELPYSG